jgi:hypothetical protein
MYTARRLRSQCFSKVSGGCRYYAPCDLVLSASGNSLGSFPGHQGGAERFATREHHDDRHAQVVEENVMRAVNSHASTVLEGWTPAVDRMGLTGRNVKRLAKPIEAL